MNKNTWDKIKYWKKKLVWPYSELVGEEYISRDSRDSKARRKKRDSKRYKNKNG